MRTLAIDLGTRRIGLALSDQGGRLATPHEVLTVSSPNLALDPILQLIAKESVKRVVIGLPLNMDDSVGPAARQTIAWAGSLRNRAPEMFATISIVFVDERLSSFAAEQQLIDRKRCGEKITRKSKRQRLDALAAAGFLQAYLDGKLPAIDVDLMSDL